MNFRLFSLKHLFCFTLTLTGYYALAQQEQQNSFFIINPIYTNPAYSGTTEIIDVSLAYKIQWLSFEGRPETAWFTFGAPITRSMGLGVVSSFERVGLQQNYNSTLNISYKIQLSGFSYLSFGLSGQYRIYTENFSELQTNQLSALSNITNVNEHYASFGGGVYYVTPQYYMGASTKTQAPLRVIGNSPDNLKLYNHTPEYALIGGFIVSQNPNIPTIRIDGLLRYSTNFYYFAGVNLILFNKLWTGINVENSHTVGLSLTYEIFPYASLSYVIQTPIASNLQPAGITQEALLRWKFPLKNKSHISKKRPVNW